MVLCNWAAKAETTILCGSSLSLRTHPIVPGHHVSRTKRQSGDSAWGYDLVLCLEALTVSAGTAELVNSGNTKHKREIHP